MKYRNSLIILALVTIFASQLASVLCWFWLDELHCHRIVEITGLCRFWDSLEYFVAHKSFTFLFYNAGYYGVIGILCYEAEQQIMSCIGIKASAMQWVFNIFGFVTSIVVGVVLGNIVGKYLHLNDIFETLYNFVN